MTAKGSKSVPVRSTYSVLDDSNRVGIEFLLVEVRTGLTFLDLADSTESEKDRRRSLENARAIYRRVMKLLPHVSLSPPEGNELRDKLNAIRERLVRAGLSVEA